MYCSLQRLGKYNWLLDALDISTRSRFSYANEIDELIVKVYEPLQIQPFDDLLNGCPYLKHISL